MLSHLLILYAFNGGVQLQLRLQLVPSQARPGVVTQLASGQFFGMVCMDARRQAVGLRVGVVVGGPKDLLVICAGIRELGILAAKDR